MLHLPSISLAACPEGWSASAAKGSSSCYQIAPKPAGQEACQNECRSLSEGASLVCIRSIEEQLFLAKQFPSQPSCCGWKDVSCCRWIGLFQSPTNKGSSVGWYAAPHKSRTLDITAESAHGPHCAGTTGGIQAVPAPTGTGSLASPTTTSQTKTAPLSGGRACPHGSMPAAIRSSPASASSSHRSPHHRHRRHQCNRPRPPRRLSRRPSRPLHPIHRRRRSSARPAFCSPTPQGSLGWRAPASPRVAARSAAHMRTASTRPTPRAVPRQGGA